MGSDLGPVAVVAGVVRFLAAQPEARIVLVGHEQELRTLCAGIAPELMARLRLHHAEQVVAMDDTARDALRQRPRSSMHVALELVRDGVASACVSGGSTAALMAVSRHIVGTLDAVRRPAIVSAIPAIGGHTFMLDLGANPECPAAMLFQFAVMGECVARDAAAIAVPRIGLLNIGQEASKGTPEIREAAAMLESADLDYVGYVEGHEIFLGKADVVVSDGFTGNVALKTMEGMGSLVRHYLTDLTAEVGARSGVSDTLAPVRAMLDPRLRNGATLVGLREVVVKSHGGADGVAFAHALETAWLENRGAIPAAIVRRFAELCPA